MHISYHNMHNIPSPYVAEPATVPAQLRATTLRLYRTLYGRERLAGGGEVWTVDTLSPLAVAVIVKLSTASPSLCSQ